MSSNGTTKVKLPSFRELDVGLPDPLASHSPNVGNNVQNVPRQQPEHSHVQVASHSLPVLPISGRGAHTPHEAPVHLIPPPMALLQQVQLPQQPTPQHTPRQQSLPQLGSTVQLPSMGLNMALPGPPQQQQHMMAVQMPLQPQPQPQPLHMNVVQIPHIQQVSPPQHVPQPNITVLQHHQLAHQPLQVLHAHTLDHLVPKRKRPRRKAQEMVRLYACNYGTCKNSYGTLNHLNAHITFKKHGPKRKPEEFKQIRELYKLQKTSNSMDKSKVLNTLGLGDKTELPVFHQQRGYNGYGRHDHTLNKNELEKLSTN
ncbi:unnamed protein product [Cyberlindnera jadinii]|uniref:C2H2-type domain-containing protein n=1 Tax=Cyberlindnera jadinii (strain ATCC 18201 / CBS 1600 / BCRC 20928 / JCM 3617 / NBRC 0987 / NRRL Y-1542) TaxID=983966 RepID=A0A0H5C134_CYBJN|nr:unnamed protein product [Cyberlindnera jadinii]